MPKLNLLFWKYVIVYGLDDCWPWIGAKQPNGYGKFGSGCAKLGTVLPHRVSYAITRGELDPNLHVCHSCDNKLCVNPTHLFSGTSRDNENDKWLKNRGIFGEAHGISKLKETDVLAMRGSTETYAVLAERFGVSVMTVGQIKAGVTWSRVGGSITPKTPRNKLTAAEKAVILESNETGYALALKYGVAACTVYALKKKHRSNS